MDIHTPKNGDDFFPTLLEGTWFEREQIRVILTHDDCSCISREGYHGDGNPNVFLKPLTKFWNILIHGYDATNTVIVDDSKEKHVCNNEGNFTIWMTHTC